MKHNLIIFSKNRPMQLDCLLRSIKENCDVFEDINVIAISNMEYDNAYSRLSVEYGFHLIWQQGSLVDHVLNYVVHQYEYTCFMCDDDIIYRPFAGEIAGNCYSSRLGDNITEGANVHFNYPMSVDGHFFKTDLIMPIIQQLPECETPNSFEVELHKYRHEFPIITIPTESFLVGIPMNKVSDNSGCWHMGISEAELNDKYLQGYRIDYKKMDFSKVNNVHMNIKPVFTHVDKLE